MVSLTEGGGKAVGVEALAALVIERAADVTTEGMIRVAEDYDLISDLDELVWRRADAPQHRRGPRRSAKRSTESKVRRRQAPRLQDTFVQLDLPLNVNVSGLELAEAGYADRVTGILANTGSPAERLLLENEPTAESHRTIANLYTLFERDVRVTSTSKFRGIGQQRCEVAYKLTPRSASTAAATAAGASASEPP